MAVSNYDQYKLQDYWRMFLLEDVWRYNQVLGTGVPVLPVDVYIQQNRDMISRAITSAAGKMADVLGYPIVPTWVSETIPYGAAYPQQMQPLKLKYGYVQEIGRRASELVQANVAIVYSAVGGLGVDDTATITVLNVSYDADEIKPFYRVVDGAPSAGNEFWEIYGENVSVTKSGTTITITAPRALFVSPNGFIKRPFENPNLNFTEINAADTSSAADFVTAVDIYRVYADTTSAVQLVSDPFYLCSDNCEDNVRNGCARLVNAELGLVQMRGYDTCACYGFPQYVRIWYKAGYPLNEITGMPDTELLEAAVRLANTTMPNRTCPICDESYDSWYQDGQQETLASHYVNNPFGTKKGQAYAWQVVEHRALGQGGKFPAPRQIYSGW